MAKAPEHRRWAVAVELPGQPRVALTCDQRQPYMGRCSSPVHRVCDACNMAICLGHAQFVSAGPRFSDLVDGAELAIDPNPAECCVTCVCLFYVYRAKPVHLSDEQRLNWLASRDAAGYCGEHEETFLRKMGYEHGPQGWMAVGKKEP